MAVVPALGVDRHPPPGQSPGMGRPYEPCTAFKEIHYSHTSADTSIRASQHAHSSSFTLSTKNAHNVIMQLLLLLSENCTVEWMLDCP